MIPSGLKVGDTFEDGGKYYKVLEIVPMGYVSKLIDKPAEKPIETPVEEVVEKKTTRGKTRK